VRTERKKDDVVSDEALGRSHQDASFSSLAQQRKATAPLAASCTTVQLTPFEFDHMKLIGPGSCLSHA